MTAPLRKPLHAKERRLLSRSEDEIYDELDQQLPYRLGWPSPMPVFPVRHLPVLPSDITAEFAEFNEVSKKIREILDGARIFCETGGPILAFRPLARSEPTNDDLTVVISAKAGQAPWLQSMFQIRKLLKEQGLHYRIEFVDFALADRVSHTVLPDHAMVDLWVTHIRSQVLTAVKNTSWQSINVLHRGTSASRAECPLTLVISAWDTNATEIWQKVIKEIRAFWNDDIELLSAENLDEMDLDLAAAGKFLTEEAITGPIRMGTSVGLESEKSSATLGGFMRLQWGDGTEADVGITNYHVVRDAPLKPQTSGNTPFNLPRPYTQNASSMTIVSPSNMDYDMVIQGHKDTIKKLDLTLNGDPSRPGFLGLVAEVDFGNFSKKPHLERLKAALQKTELEKAAAESSQRVAGFVAAASGDRTAHHAGQTWPLDWAAIKLLRPHSSELLGIPPFNPLSVYEGFPVTMWSAAVSPDMAIAKLGRSTHWTSGRVNSIKTDLRLLRQIGNNEYDVYGQVSVWCIPTSTKSSTKFVSPGDSGAWILSGDISNTSPVAIGLFSCSQNASGLAYFVPMDVVINDIERVTGAKVVFPTKA